MSIDLSQFFDVFFEESLEGLDIMESELLDLEPGTPDNEIINTIFRAAHSIKGGSGTFGFTSVTEFTHVVETLLDQIRDGKRLLTRVQIDLFLQSVDCIREMLDALRSKEEPETEVASELKAQFEAILNSDDSDSSASITASTTASANAPVSSTSHTHSQSTPPKINENDNEAELIGWKIHFVPGKDILKTGNEPIYMFQELSELGKLDIDIYTDHVPKIDTLEAEDCYFYWHLTLHANCEKSKIDEIFEWVIDDCEIEIKPIYKSSAISTPNDGTSASVIGTDATDTDASDTSVSEAAYAEDSTNNNKDGSKDSRKDSAPSTEALPVNNAKTASTPSKAKKDSAPKNAEATSIRVGIEKVDSLINMVGELVITQAMLTQLSEGDFDKSKIVSLQEGLSQLAHNTRDLQESVMRIRMLPISFVFSRFPRLVRDTSTKLGKKIDLKLQGEQTELDKTVMEKISDPMVHLVRNAMDHGLETTEERITSGKPEVGSLTLNAFHQGGNIVIEIIDDGKGVNTKKVKEKAISNGLINANSELTDDEINLLIFEPGFSTADVVSDLSGRGVGMDVVRRNIQALNGSVELASKPGEGSIFTIRLPLTLAILDGQLIRVGLHTYIIPLVNIIESLQIDLSQVNTVGGEYDVLRLRDEYIPIIRLFDLFNHEPDSKKIEEGLLVIVENDNEKIGILVDELLAQQQVVIKSLAANYMKVEGISGATILGDGTVSLILDISGAIKLAGLKKNNIRDIGQLTESSETSELA